jgi:hypothetical protein
LVIGALRVRLEKQKAKEALLFVNKKKQKNFDYLKPRPRSSPNPQENRSFLLLFSKKKRFLPFPNSL